MIGEYPLCCKSMHFCIGNQCYVIYFHWFIGSFTSQPHKKELYYEVSFTKSGCSKVLCKRSKPCISISFGFPHTIPYFSKSFISSLEYMPNFHLNTSLLFISIIPCDNTFHIPLSHHTWSKYPLGCPVGFI